MQETLEALKRLHIFDRRMARVEQDIRILPHRLEEIEARFAGKQSSIENMERRISRLTDTRNQKSDFLTQEHEHLKQLEARQTLVKNERELDALNREMDASRKLIQNVEEEVQRFNATIDEQKAKLADLRKSLDEERAGFSGEVADINQRLQQRKQELESRRDERDELLKALDKSMAAKYERVKRFQRYALAVVQDDLCHACHMHIPPQIYNLVQRSEQIQLCPSCHRILVMPDDDLLAAEQEIAEAERAEEDALKRAAEATAEAQAAAKDEGASSEPASV